ncbi:MAG: hypothetical protein QXP77_01460 [Candidatus Aenigmatarchaeota archaeon]
MTEALFWVKEKNGIRCNLCAWNCFIKNGEKGYCEARENRNNNLIPLNFGKLTSIEVKDIEEIPLFHFLPSSKTLLINSIGKNLRGQFFSNEILKEKGKKIQEISPEDLIDEADNKKVSSITFGGNAEVYFEFAYKTARFAKRSNIATVFLTHGYIEEEPIKKIGKYLDAALVNIIASADPDFYKRFIGIEDTSPIFLTLKQLMKQRIFIEVSNLIVPKLGDNTEFCKKLAEFINAELSSEIPFHILQFHPGFGLPELPKTPIKILEKCLEEAKMAGLRYVYISNVETYRNTYCYNCGEPLISRKEKVEVRLVGGRCPICGLKTNLLIK